MPDLQNLMAQAMKCHRAGRLQEAAALYAQILQERPDDAQTLHLMGVIAHQSGREDEALSLIRRSIAINDRVPEFHSNLGLVLATTGRFEEAAGSFRHALVLNPKLPEVIYNLASALRQLGRNEDALLLYREVLSLCPEQQESFGQIGDICRTLRRWDEAVDAYRNLLKLRPEEPAVYFNLAWVLWERGDINEALENWALALKLKPDCGDWYNNLGNRLKELNRREEAVKCYRQAIAHSPAVHEFHRNMGITLRELGRLDEAAAADSKSIEIQPKQSEAYCALAAVLSEQGKLDEAIAAERKAIEFNPTDSATYINLLNCLFHHPDSDAWTLRREIENWAATTGQTVSRTHPHGNDRNSERRLRIGYLSPYFYNCADAHFLLPLLSTHDKRNFEIFVYNRSPAKDATTDRLRPWADGWADILPLIDKQVADRIESDRIDILNIVSEPAGFCLPPAAMQPAPVQVAWLTFGSATTGLPAVHYRISDPYLDPVGMDESCYTEKTVRLPETAWCYHPLIDDTPIQPPPFEKNGYITFGSLQRFTKINPQVLALWARVMNQIPNSRLLILARAGSHRQIAVDHLSESGISAERIEFIEPMPAARYMEQFQRVDIVLDTFPYSGHTTALDALWSGVPVVALTGRTSVGRAATSALRNLQLDDLIAGSEDEYVQIAGKLAGDPQRLIELRNSLRPLMQKSPLMNAERFARNIEEIYREIWRKWSK